MSDGQYKDNTGVLFKNTRKSAENHPDYTGNLTVNGQKLDLAAWLKEGRNGKFMALSVKAAQPDGRRQHHREFDRPTAAKIRRTEAARRRVMF